MDRRTYQEKQQIIPDLLITGEGFSFEKPTKGEMFGVLHLNNEDGTSVTIAFQEKERFQAVRRWEAGIGGEINLKPQEVVNLLNGFDDTKLIPDEDEWSEYIQFRNIVATLMNSKS